MHTYYYIDNLSIKLKDRYAQDNIEVKSPHEVLDLELQDNDNIIINCELNINEHDKEVLRTDFYGITIAQKLRLKGFTGKVLFVSFLSLEYFTQESKYSIITYPGHNFAQLPINYSNLKASFEQFSYPSVADLMVIANSFCSRKGLIDTLTHSLISDISGTNNYKDKAAEIVKELIQYSDDKDSAILSEFDKRFPKIDDKNINEVSAYIKELGSRIQLSIVDTEYKDGDGDADHKSNNKNILLPTAEYEVLWLDDEVSEDNLVYKKLSGIGKILKVHLAKTVEEASKILDEDIDEKNYRPKIMVVIVDYFLKINGKYDDKQGYKLIEKIARENILVKIITHSSVSKHIQNKIAKSYGVQVTPYYKQDNQRLWEINEFVEEIITLGNENYERFMHLPSVSSASWKRLEGSYKQLVTHLFNEPIEDEISRRALAWINDYCENGKPTKSLIKFDANIFSPKLISKKESISFYDKFFADFYAFRKINESNYINNFNAIIDSYKEESEKRIENEFNNLKSLKKQAKDLTDLIDIEQLKKISTQIYLKELEKAVRYFKTQWKKKELPGFINNTEKRSSELDDFDRNISSSLLKEFKSFVLDSDEMKNTDLYSEENINHAINIFAARRVILYLSIVEGFLFADGSYNRNINECLGTKDSTRTQCINTWAALTPSIFPSGITVEEKNWFTRNYSKKLKNRGLDIAKENEDFQLFIEKITKIFSEYFNESSVTKRSKKHPNTINNIEFKVIIPNSGNKKTGKPLRFKTYKFYFVGNRLENLQTIDEAKELINWIKEEQLDGSNKDEFRIFIKLWRQLLSITDKYSFEIIDDETLKKHIRTKISWRSEMLSFITFLKTMHPKNKNFKNQILENNILLSNYEAIKISMKSKGSSFRDELKLFIDKETNDKKYAKGGVIKNNIESEYIYNYSPIDLLFRGKTRLRKKYETLKKGFEEKINSLFHIHNQLNKLDKENIKSKKKIELERNKTLLWSEVTPLYCRAFERFLKILVDEEISKLKKGKAKIDIEDIKINTVPVSVKKHLFSEKLTKNDELFLKYHNYTSVYNSNIYEYISDVYENNLTENEAILYGIQLQKLKNNKLFEIFEKEYSISSIVRRNDKDEDNREELDRYVEPENQSPIQETFFDKVDVDYHKQIVDLFLMYPEENEEFAKDRISNLEQYFWIPYEDFISNNFLQFVKNNIDFNSTTQRYLLAFLVEEIETIFGISNFEEDNHIILNKFNDRSISNNDKLFIIPFK